MRIEYPHHYSHKEAVQRVDRLFAKLHAEYSSDFSDLQHTWNADQTGKHYSFKIHGMMLSGTITMESSLVIFEAKLPWAVKIMEKEIEKMVLRQLDKAFG